MTVALKSTIDIRGVDGIHRPLSAYRLVFDGPFVSFYDYNGQVVLSTRADAIAEIDLPDIFADTNLAIQGTTREILNGNLKTYQLTQAYIRRTFLTVYAMNLVLFAFGVIAFVAAVVKGFEASSASDTVPALFLGGLSVTSFVTIFLSRPVEAMSIQGPRLSWLLAILNTYWTRLVYFTDAEKIDEDLVRAERDLVARLFEFYEQTEANAVNVREPSRRGRRPRVQNKRKVASTDNQPGAAADAVEEDRVKNGVPTV
jgi:hypothetical protein